MSAANAGQKQRRGKCEREAIEFHRCLLNSFERLFPAARVTVDVTRYRAQSCEGQHVEDQECESRDRAEAIFCRGAVDQWVDAFLYDALIESTTEMSANCSDEEFE